jgi:hypothetical protein
MTTSSMDPQHLVCDYLDQEVMPELRTLARCHRMTRWSLYAT